MKEKPIVKKTKNPNVNINSSKREKFLKPLIMDEDVKEDQDALLSVVKNRKTQKQKIADRNDPNSTFYISPIRGKVQDRSTFPVTTSSGKIAKQYDFLRSLKKVDEEDIKTKLGHEYYEFKLYNGRYQEVPKNSNPTKPTPQQKEPVREEKTFDDLFEPAPSKKTNVGVIYEEELIIDLDETQKVSTSYEETSQVPFYNDYQEPIKQNTPVQTKPSINIYEHIAQPNDFRADIKRLFDDLNTNEEEENVFFKEELTFDKSEPVVEEKPTVRFQDLNESIEEEVKKPIRQKTVYTPPLKASSHYTFPPIELLNESSTFMRDDTDWIESQMNLLDATLESFGVAAKTVDYTHGPSVTRFEIEPEPGIKVSKITALQDDIKLRLAASDIRMEAPISGKSTVGIEVPNQETRMVRLREIIDSVSYKTYKSPLKIALGLDITGEAVYSDISNMTHSLIAGSTGSGKSVCINTIIVSILYNALPDEVKLVLIDPKKVEFSSYRDIPHLLTPVINDPKVATATLRWITEEMHRRYELIESVGARDIKSYNLKRNRSLKEMEKLPYIVVIIDELADLMLIAAAEIEEYFQRISQLARAAGIHLIVATQRPSTNVITGTIKTNIPTRVAFKVSSAIDSRIILDESGAEKLLGKGDMLLIENGKPFLKRVQGSFISDEEIEKVTRFVKDQMSPIYQFTGEDLLKKDNEMINDYEDDLFDDVARFVINLGEASASRLQRQFKVGYNRAARLVDMLEKYQIIGPQQNGSKPREVLMSLDEYEELISR